MGAFRRYHPLSLALLLALFMDGAATAAAGEAGLYDQPVLTLDPGRHTAPIRRADVSTPHWRKGNYDENPIPLCGRPDDKN
jgi:hypothetical protein